jgi:cysteine desulfuration protein SufE
MSIEERQQELISEFSMMAEWMEKYEYIIELGKEMTPLAESEKSDELLIRGCQSRVWLKSSFSNNGLLHFRGDSDAVITKGLVALMIRVYDGQRAEDILKNEPHFIRDIGLQQHLSPTRSNGLASMVAKIRDCALTYKIAGQ